jgi:predicted small lipoprotein YifL
MKTISKLLLLALAITTLAACGEMGKGPEKPASAKALLEK